MSAIFLLPVCLTTDLESIQHASPPTLTLTFDRLTLNSCHTWRVTWPTLPPSLKNLRLFVHDIRIITVPIDYHRKCVRGHCACAESRDPWVGGQNDCIFWNPWPRFGYSLYNFYWATTTIKGRVLSSRPMLKPFSGEKNLIPVEIRGMGGRNLRFWFCDPQKALSCAEPRRLTYFVSKSVRASRL